MLHFKNRPIQVTGICRAACLAAAALLIGQDSRAATFGLDAGYPGPDPGAARIDWRGQDITLRTAAISASWTVAPQGLRPTMVRDESPVSPRERGIPAGPRSLTLGGEVFQIVLSGAQRYPASALIVEGKPRVSEVAPDPKAAGLAARITARQVELTLHSLDGRLRVVWRAVIHDGANYVRQEIEVSPAREDCVVQEIIWLDEDLPAARTAGRVDGSPVVVGDFFAGCEDPHALNLVAAAPSKLGLGQRADADGKSLLSGSTGRASCRLRRNAPLHRGETLTQSFVFGVAPPGQIRRAFLYYLERERAHPYRPFLHYNSWYDIAWDPFALNEANCLDAIRLCGDHLIKEHGVVVDAMVFDDGWDDPRTLWQFHLGFPRGFSPLADLCEQYGTHLGVWLSPFGGYGSPREQRLAFGRQQGFEVNANGFSLAGPKYYAAFKRACLGMMRNYRVNHFKFDGIASGMSASGPGAGYLLDTEAMRRLMLELRQEDPNVYVNLTTGSWPSPFWLRFADSVWRQGGDMGLAGKGSKQQQWLTYRDQETYRNIVCRGPLFPLNSLMTQGVAYSRRGTAGEPTFNSAGFKDDVRAFFGSGTGLQELYIQPGKLTAEDWSVLAEAAKWSRANADVLVDTHWLGGDPGKLEVSGFASWSPRKGIVMLRNPDDRPQDFVLEIQAAFELPPGAPTKYLLHSPWSEDRSKAAIPAEAGKPVRLTLKPFEVLVFDAAPVGPSTSQPTRVNRASRKVLAAVGPA